MSSSPESDTTTTSPTFRALVVNAGVSRRSMAQPYAVIIGTALENRKCPLRRLCLRGQDVIDLTLEAGDFFPPDPRDQDRCGARRRSDRERWAAGRGPADTATTSRRRGVGSDGGRH